MDLTNIEQRDRDEDEISLLDLISTLMRHKRLIVGASAVAAAGALLFSIGSLILPPKISYLPNLYTPRALVLVSTSGSGGLSGMLGSASSLAALAGVSLGGGQSNGELGVFLAKTNATLDELNEEFDFTTRYKVKKNPKTETRTAILERLSVAFDEKTSVLSIAFEDLDPVYAQAVVNRCVEILDRRFASLGGNKALSEKERLEVKLADVQTQISILEEKANAFSAKYGVLDVEAMATEQVTVLATLRSELILKDMEIENYERFSTIDDPVIRRLRSEAASISAKIAEVERGGSLLPSQRDIPKLAFEYAGLKRDLMVQMEIFKLLTQQYELAKLNSEGQEPAFQVLELAEVPDKKSGPSRGMITAVATMSAFFLAVLAAFVLEAISNIKKDPEAMKKLRGEA